MVVTWSDLYSRADPFISTELDRILGCVHMDTKTKHAVFDGYDWHSDYDWQTAHQHQFIDGCRYLFELENG